MGQYYPPNINHSRCCDQAICTECFVQIKRADPTTTHIVSEPAACPYCVQDKFGVVYAPPPWRAGIGSDSTVSVMLQPSSASLMFVLSLQFLKPIFGQTPAHWPDLPKGSHNAIDTLRPSHKRRQKSFGHDSPEVVTTGLSSININRSPVDVVF